MKGFMNWRSVCGKFKTCKSFVICCKEIMVMRTGCLFPGFPCAVCAAFNPESPARVGCLSKNFISDIRISVIEKDGQIIGNVMYTKAKLVDKNGEVIIFKNNKPKYKLVDIEHDTTIEMTDDEKIDFVAARILKLYRPAFEELGK